MIQELFGSSISVQKVELTNNKNHEFENYEDDYDVHIVNMKDVSSSLKIALYKLRSRF